MIHVIILSKISCICKQTSSTFTTATITATATTICHHQHRTVIIMTNTYTFSSFTTISTQLYCCEDTRLGKGNSMGG